MNYPKPLDRKDWEQCEACFRVYPAEQIVKVITDPITGEQSDFCFTNCDEESPFRLCDGTCGDAYRVEDLTNGGEYDPSNYYCHDCLMDSRELRQVAIDQEWDYWHS